jgi:hypothetical protein
LRSRIAGSACRIHNEGHFLSAYPHSGSGPKSNEETIYVINSCIFFEENALITENTSAGLVLRVRVFPRGSAMRFRFVIY